MSDKRKNEVDTESPDFARLELAGLLAPYLRSATDKTLGRRVTVYNQETGEVVGEGTGADLLRGLSVLDEIRHAVQPGVRSKRAKCMTCKRPLDVTHRWGARRKCERCKFGVCERCGAYRTDNKTRNKTGLCGECLTDGRRKGAIGGAYERRGSFYMRITVAPQRRESVQLPWVTAEHWSSHVAGSACPCVACGRARTIQAMVNRLREANETSWIEKYLEIGATADDEKLAGMWRVTNGIVSGEIVHAESNA